MTPTFPIKKRINTELFIERTTALYFYQERLERDEGDHRLGIL